jgi:hypothetical protein
VIWAEENIPPIKRIAIRGIPGLPANVADDSLLIDAKSKGVKNVMVWLAPEKNGPPIPINAALMAGPAVPVTLTQASGLYEPLFPINAAFIGGPPFPGTITQASGFYVPRIVMIRSNQPVTLVNGLPVPDQYLLLGAERANGAIQVPLPAGARRKLNLVPETKPLLVGSPIFDWMKGRIGVFDHPYFGLTDKDGNFEIKLAPVGNFRIYILHEQVGWLHKQSGERLSDGQNITIRPGINELGTIPMKNLN